MTRTRPLRPWPGIYRPVWVAAATTGRSGKTIRTWVRAGKLPSRKDGRTGELLVHLAEAQRLHETTGRRFRRLPEPVSEAAGCGRSDLRAS